ncbi:cytidine deaminase [Salinispirillum sp. LH 10-3-1]|uniref:Cytidine deaminase n=1 Tax=Salinispirillum sp. LH 10-3-1 TaxID=2952525 RepID=A0AB38YJA0_9GAMM
MKQKPAIVKQLTGPLDVARAAMQQAYVPYSNFSVGAVVVSTSGRMYSGCNVENAAYPEGTCAEAGAIAAMVLAGERDIAEIYVMGEGDEMVTPCGGCRQKIREFAAPHTPIHICNTEAIRATLTLDDLLPHSFGPGHLESR